MEYTKGKCHCWMRREGKDTGETDQCSKCIATNDMYEALKELREWLKSEDVQVLGKGFTEQFGIPKTFEKVDRALAKADGGK